MKVCTKCKVEKELCEFGRSISAKDGLRSYCKECARARNKVTRDRYRAMNQGKEPNREGTKWCPACKEQVERTNWAVKPGALDGLDGYCLDCSALRNGVFHARKGGYKFTIPPGITGALVRQMRKDQDYKCLFYEICGFKENGKRLSLDHFHESGEWRGMVCNFCNVTVLRWADQINDNTKRLRAVEMIHNYLENPPAKKYCEQFRSV